MFQGLFFLHLLLRVLHRMALFLHRLVTFHEASLVLSIVHALFRFFHPSGLLLKLFLHEFFKLTDLSGDANPNNSPLLAN